MNRVKQYNQLSIFMATSTHFNICITNRIFRLFFTFCFLMENCRLSHRNSIVNNKRWCHMKIQCVLITVFIEILVFYPKKITHRFFDLFLKLWVYHHPFCRLFFPSDFIVTLSNTALGATNQNTEMDFPGMLMLSIVSAIVDPYRFS